MIKPPGHMKSREYSGRVSDTEKVPDEGSAEEVTSRLTGASAIKTHLTLVIGLALCVAAFWFELSRAEGGNELSWAYVFEWPLLGVFAVYMWWKILHPGFTIRRSREKPGIAPEYQGMLEAWQGEVRKLEMNRQAEGTAGAAPGDAVNGVDE
jgi:hypothetical protein